MKKILILATTPFLNDGLTKIVFDVIKNNKESVIFEVASPFGFDNKYGEYLKTSGIKRYSLTDRKKILAYMKDIYDITRQGNYDSVYINGNSAMMFIQAFPSKLAGARVVTHCHNTSTEHPVFHYLFKPAFNLIVDEKIGCSSLASQWAYYGNNVKTIVNGVEVDRFRFNEVIRRNIRTELGWENQKIVGHIGRLNYQKNHEKLINVFKRMHEIDNSCRLLMIGSGKLQPKIENQIGKLQIENVIKIINYTDVPQNYMQAMDIMILPSRFEGLCLVALEAQANGLPVLIDSYFSPETSATEQARILNLKAPDEIWAAKALDMVRDGRRDVAQQIKDNKMNYSDMIDSIREVLMG